MITCGCSSSGRAPPCQGGGSEFEPRQPLQNKHCAFCAVISAAVAHLVERHLAKVEVASSSLVSRSKKKAPVIDRCFLFGIRGNSTTFGRQSRPKVDAATRPRLAPARRRFAVTYAAPVGRSLTKSVLDGRIWCLWTGRHPGWPAVRYPLAQNPKHFGEQICVRYSPAISRKRQKACARFLISDLQLTGAISPPSCRYGARRPT